MAWLCIGVSMLILLGMGVVLSQGGEGSGSSGQCTDVLNPEGGEMPKEPIQTVIRTLPGGRTERCALFENGWRICAVFGDPSKGGDKALDSRLQISVVVGDLPEARPSLQVFARQEG